MHIYILRHGEAEPQKTTDEARNLTATGRVDVAKIITSAAQDLNAVQQLWVSPLVRAQQTASIVCDFLAFPERRFLLKTTGLIVPEANPYTLFAALQDAQLDSILLVSHQPLVGQAIDLLCGGDDGFHVMNTSSLACVECDMVAAKMGKLRWLRHANEQ
jgi:phosphohistidine phosphatase